MGGQNLSAVAARRPAGMGYLRADVLVRQRHFVIFGVTGISGTATA
jgi:hypothetical protein